MSKALHLILDNIKPINLNNCYTISSIGGKIRRFPSKEYKQFESSVNIQLRKYKNEINKFNKEFNQEKHYLVCEYKFYMPVMTKDNRVSQRSGDCSNLVKAIEDIIFKNLLCDDSHITELLISKIHSNEIRTEMNLFIKYL